MKKTLSILLSILIIALSFTFIAGAEECTCKDHTNDAKGCHCCVYCPNLDTFYLTSCVKNPDGSLKKNADGMVEFCCTDCDGISPCACTTCACCSSENDSTVTGPDQILTPDQQEQVINGFQSILGRIREFFDKLFDAIFKFLRFDEIMGNN